MNIAPIVLFVFNRPDHTKKTIESLLVNSLADCSDLFIFSDGAKRLDDVKPVNKVREYLKSIKGFRSIKIVEQDKNIGLAKSVINGVEEVIQEFGKVIVIEDDLLLARGFLTYMNQALDIYEGNSKVFSVGGYSPPISISKQYALDSYLSYRCCTWGWATWADRWSKVDWQVRDFDAFINDSSLVRQFNRGGDDMSELLRLQMLGKINSWGIRWDYAHFKNQAFCFRPTQSLAFSSGNDGSGIHCGITEKYDVELSEKVNFSFPSNHELKVDSDINNIFATFYDGRVRSQASDPAYVVNSNKSKFLPKLKAFLSSLKSGGVK